MPLNPANVVGRELYFDKLRAALLGAEHGIFLLSGEPGSGKSTLAQMFSWQVHKAFEAVIYQTCGERSMELIARDLADTLKEQIGEQITQLPTGQKLRTIKQWLQQRRSLLVLDDVWLAEAQSNHTKSNSAIDARDLQELLPGPPVSVLFTSRRPALPWVPAACRMQVEAFTPAEVEATFRAYLGAQTVERYKSELLQFAERMERLPLAVAVGAQLLQAEFGPLNEVARGLKLSDLSNTIHDVPGLLQRAIQAQGATGQQLLAAAATCSAEDFWLPLAVAITGLETTAAAAARNHLVNAGLLRMVDQDRQRFHLHSLVREQMQRMITEQMDSLQEKHTQALERIFENWENRWKDCRECLSEIIPAGQRLFARGETNRAEVLMYRSYATASRIGELATALQIEKSTEVFWLASTDPDAKDGLQCSYGNQALVLQAWGRLEEALALHKKQEAICEELGNKDGLQASYGNQALILRRWGRLEEALALHKKEEAICEELGNKDGLQASYGNQAVILQAWGRLEEALALHKKEEAICEELGNKDGLQASYGNQAGILQDWGRLEEALALLKKKEAICEELGNKDSLQRSYGNQAVILQAWGRLEEALALHKKQEAICEELGNKDSLQRSYGNQAVILQAWGRLEEALALHKKKEAICEKLGNRASLAYCYWSWGLLARELRDPPTEKQKLEAALAIFTELNMPRERDSVQKELNGSATNAAAGD